MDQRPTGLKLWQVFLLLFWFLILNIFLSNIVVWAGKQLHYPVADSLLLSGVIFLAASALTITTGVLIFRFPFSPGLSLTSLHPTLFPVLISSVLGVIIIGSELDNLFRFSFHVPLTPVSANTPIPGLWESILVTVVLIPVALEALFRGYFLKGLLSEYIEEIAVIATGAFSGLVFASPTVVILGLLTGWVYARTRSLIPCIFMGMLNFCIPILMESTKLIIPGFNSDPSLLKLQPLWFDGIGIVLLTLGIWLLIRFYGKSQRPGTAG